MSLAENPVTARAYDLGKKEAHLELARAPKPNGLTASARRIDISKDTERQRIKAAHARQDAAHNLAWEFHDRVPEVKNGARFKGQKLSRLRLVGAVQLSPGAEPTPLDDLAERTDIEQPPPALVELIQDTVNRLGSGDSTHGALLNRYGRHSFVVGDSYLVSYTEPDGTEVWYQASPRELRVNSDDKVALCRDPDSKVDEWVVLDETAIIVRIWNQHAEYGDWSDSSVLGNLDICELLYALNNAMLGATYSQANNGVLLLPSGLVTDEPRIPVGERVEGEQIKSPTIRNMVESLMAPVSDPRSGSSVIPYVLTGPIEDIAGARHLTLDRPFDATIDARLEAARTRFGDSAALPTEVFTGFGDVKFANAFKISKQTWDDYLKSDAQDYVWGVTTGLLRPIVKASQVPIDPTWAGRACIWYDTSELIEEDDETGMVFDAVDRGLIGDVGARARLHIEESEKPTPDDIQRRIELRGTRQDQRQSQTDGPSTTQTATAQAITAAAPARASRQRELTALGRRWAQRDRSMMDRSMALADAAMFRALERAGGRMRTAVRSSGFKDVIDGAPNRDVVALLGPAVVASVNLSAEGLLDGQFDELGRRFRAMVARSQEQTRSELARLGLEGDDLAELEARQEQDREAGVSALTAGMLTLATVRLFSPSPNAPELGEHDSNLSVPAGDIRVALARAGGAQGNPGPGGAIRSPLDGAVAGGVATGETVTGMLQALHVSRSAWAWTYGGSDRPFPPHEDLDGVEFTAWTDERLVNDQAWPSDGFFYPGDHAGCQCYAAPILTDDEE